MPTPTISEYQIAGQLYVTPGRLAEMLGVCVRTLNRWEAQGGGPPRITLGKKKVLYDVSKLPEWLASHET